MIWQSNRKATLIASSSHWPPSILPLVFLTRVLYTASTREEMMAEESPQPISPPSTKGRPSMP
jgi:hypothetical protein